MCIRDRWRISFDPIDGLLYVGDVGQGEWEEVDVVPIDAAGLNYGWPILEGEHCFAEPECDTSGLVLPAVEYAHDGDPGGCTVIGGYVYRGTDLPELVGHYLYADLCGAWIRSFRYADGVVTDQRDWTDDVNRPIPLPYSFGVDGRGELYLMTSSGFVFRFTRG